MEGPGFAEAAEQVLGSVELWEAIKEFIEGYIARDPTIGRPVPGTHLRAFSLDTTPPATIFYLIEETTDRSGHKVGIIRLLDIQDV